MKRIILILSIFIFNFSNAKELTLDDLGSSMTELNSDKVEKKSKLRVLNSTPDKTLEILNKQIEEITSTGTIKTLENISTSMNELDSSATEILGNMGMDISALQLSGDAKTACEVILCLASSVRPSECSNPLKIFYAIKAKKWKKTLSLRKAFLSLCPIGEEVESDPAFQELKEYILSGDLVQKCDIDKLNTPEVKKENGDEWVSNKEEDGDEIRIMPNLPPICKKLSHNVFSDYNPQYTCNTKDKDRWYSRKDWNNGFYLQEISKGEYEEIEDESLKSTRSIEGIIIAYYKKIRIQKKCWKL